MVFAYRTRGFGPVGIEHQDSSAQKHQGHSSAKQGRFPLHPSAATTMSLGPISTLGVFCIVALLACVAQHLDTQTPNYGPFGNLLATYMRHGGPSKTTRLAAAVASGSMSSSSSASRMNEEGVVQQGVATTAGGTDHLQGETALMRQKTSSTKKSSPSASFSTKATLTPEQRTAALRERLRNVRLPAAPKDGPWVPILRMIRGLESGVRELFRMLTGTISADSARRKLLMASADEI
ncbi:unnamed protein product [Amoebophrya sp. A25]|nr:unnamed protein product [Amoebophrya sp. A25]|eukprot:GSA25T00002860001.1